MRAEKWEYSTVYLNVAGFFGPRMDTEALNAELNAHGEAGWELVSAFDVNRVRGATSGIVALFTRSRG